MLWADLTLISPISNESSNCPKTPILSVIEREHVNDWSCKIPLLESNTLLLYLPDWDPGSIFGGVAVVIANFDDADPVVAYDKRRVVARETLTAVFRSLLTDSTFPQLTEV